MIYTSTFSARPRPRVCRKGGVSMLSVFIEEVHASIIFYNTVVIAHYLNLIEIEHKIYMK